MNDTVYTILAMAGIFYVMARTGKAISLATLSLLGRIRKSRLEQATDVVCDELEHIAGNSGVSVRIESDRYIVMIVPKSTQGNTND